MNKITITRDDFKNAVDKAIEEFVNDVSEEDDNVKDMMTIFLMGLQGVTFAAVIERHLFGKEPSKEDTTNVNDEKEGK